MAEKPAKCNPNGIKIAIFSKNYKIFQKVAHSLRRLGTTPTPPSVIRLSYNIFFIAPPQQNLTHCLKTLTFGSSAPPLAKCCLRTNPVP